MEQIGNGLGSVFDYLRANPQYGLLVAILLVLFYGLGLLKDWDWTLLGGSSGGMLDAFIDMFGRTRVRLFLGVFTALLLVCLVYMYFSY